MHGMAIPGFHPGMSGAPMMPFPPHMPPRPGMMPPHPFPGMPGMIPGMVPGMMPGMPFPRPGFPPPVAPLAVPSPTAAQPLPPPLAPLAAPTAAAPATVISAAPVLRVPPGAPTPTAAATNQVLQNFNVSNTQCVFINPTSDLLNRSIFNNAMAGLPLTIFCGNVPRSLEDKVLLRIFECCGKVQRMVRPTDPVTQLPSVSDYFLLLVYISLTLTLGS